jgi:DNA primase
VELLRKDSPSLAADAPIVTKSTVQKLGAIVEMDADTQSQLQQVIDYYHQTLKESPVALGYLAGRGLGSREMVDRFRLGYANRTLGYHLPNKQRQAGAEIRGQLESVGIYRKTGHEHFAGSLVIPVFDENGAVTEVYGRKIGERLRKGTPRHLYLPGPHRGVWNVSALQSSKEVILCESLIDALTFWCAGYRNVTASYGIEGFTDEHLDAFKRYGTERVLIAYDGDEAGDKASSSLAARLMSDRIDCYRIQFPKGMDANEYALQVRPAKKSLGLVIEKAEWLGQGERPEVSTVSASNEEPIEATKKEKDDDAERRAVVNPPPSLADVETNQEMKSPLLRQGYEGQAQPPSSKVETEPLAQPASSKVETPPLAQPSSPKGEVLLSFGDRRWRIRGLEKNLSVSVMKVNLLVNAGDAFHVDTFDLYAARHRQAFIKQASDELSINEDVIKRDLGKVLLHLEGLQDEQIDKTLEPKNKPAVKLTEAERSEALALLRDPQLLGRVLADFEKCGVVGEETNKLVGYLAAACVNS